MKEKSVISCCEFTAVAGSALGMRKSAGVCAPPCALERSLFPGSLRPGAGLLLPPCDRSQMWGYLHRRPPPTSCRTRPCRASCLPPPQPGRWEVTPLVTGHAAVPQDCTASRRHPSVFQAKTYLRSFNHILPCRKRKVLLPDPPRR